MKKGSVSEKRAVYGEKWNFLLKECTLSFVVNNSFGEGFQNIFPLANSFAKWKMLGAGRHPTGPKWGE